MIVGWWLDVPPGELAGDPRLPDEFENIYHAFNQVTTWGDGDKLVPKGCSDYELKVRLLRTQQVLSGISIGVIAREEYATTRAVSETVKEVLARLAFILRAADQQD